MNKQIASTSLSRLSEDLNKCFFSIKPEKNQQIQSKQNEPEEKKRNEEDTKTKQKLGNTKLQF